VQGEQGNQGEENQQVQLQEAWMNWPDEIPALPQAEELQLNLNVAPAAVHQELNAPVMVVQDLNMAPADEDPQEVIVHPGQGEGQVEQQQILPQVLPPQDEVLEEVADNLDQQLDVNIPPLQHPMENFLHHEIHEDDLMDLEVQEMGLNQPEDEGHQVFQHNIQLGMVRTFFFNPPEPVKAAPPEFPWLAPKPLDPKGKKDKTVVEIPTAWLGYFKALLLSPAQNGWAKQLLQSNFPELLVEKSDSVAQLSLKQQLPAPDACSLLETELSAVKAIEENITEDFQPTESPGKKRLRKGKIGTPIVDSVVRRSTRVRATSNGFKVNTYKTKNCLGYCTAPPTLPHAMIKKIGKSVCQLDEEQLEEQILMGRRKLEPVGKKQKKTNDDKKDNDKKEDPEVEEDH